MLVYFFERLAEPHCPDSVTVSKRDKLPTVGDFGITEYKWPDVTLWFIDDDKFTNDERKAAHDSHPRRSC